MKELNHDRNIAFVGAELCAFKVICRNSRPRVLLVREPQPFRFPPVFLIHERNAYQLFGVVALVAVEGLALDQLVFDINNSAFFLDMRYYLVRSSGWAVNVHMWSEPREVKAPTTAVLASQKHSPHARLTTLLDHIEGNDATELFHDCIYILHTVMTESI